PRRGGPRSWHPRSRPAWSAARPGRRAEAESLARAEPRAPLGPHLGQHLGSHDGLPPAAGVGLDRPDDHAARERRNGPEPRAGGLLPRDLVPHLEAPGERRRELDRLAAVGPRLVQAGGVLGEVVARRRVGAAATTGANRRELASAAPAAEP